MFVERRKCLHQRDSRLGLFFDKYLTEGLAIGETPKLLLAKSCSAGWTAQERAMNRVLVVDDHTVIRRGIQNILRAWPEWEISGEAASGEEAVELTKELKPDIVLMDISMPGMGGLEATKLIRKIYPQAKILMLTLHDSPEWAEMALRAGARGYVLKSDSEGELLRALKVVAADGVYTSPSLDADRVKKIMGEMGMAG